MSTVRIALANLEFPSSPDASVRLAETAIADAASAGASVVCFPEAYVPGYRSATTDVAPPDAGFLERAWSTVAAAAGQHRIGVILGTERITSRGLLISALVVNPDGTVAGFQDKVQIDPSEERTYVAGDERRVFTIGAPGGSPARGAALTFGVVI